MTDKYKNLLAGMLAAAVFRPFFGIGSGVVAAAVAGAGKVLYDFAFGGDVSAADFMATVVGGVAIEAGFTIFEAA